MGRNYDAAVVSAGFDGISLGSTATATANMSAVTKRYGASGRILYRPTCSSANVPA
jgi:ESS family glutamate:Na+ symporter